jgi:peptidoglycan/xylan/chitin deacetylase (PgdA/CDA1 family)
MAAPNRATFLRRRAVAGLVLAAGIFALGVALSRDREAPSSTGTGAAARPVRARPQARTDVAAIAGRANVPVLCYHQIRPLTASDAAADRTYIVPPTVLDAQLAALKRAGFASVSADDVAAHMAEGKPLGRKPVLITFDDASAGQYTRALPILRRHGFEATFFIMTVVLGKQGWLTRGQVRALDREGMEIAAHTWDHRAVPSYAEDDWRVQITEPKAELETIVGHSVDVFAYPFGEWDAAAFGHLRDAGFRIAFQLSDKIDVAAPMLTVRRVLVGPDVGGRELLTMIRRDF